MSFKAIIMFTLFNYLPGENLSEKFLVKTKYKIAKMVLLKMSSSISYTTKRKTPHSKYDGADGREKVYEP